MKMIFDKIKSFFLNKSSSYLYYKENYIKQSEINESNQRKIKELEQLLNFQKEVIDKMDDEKRMLNEILDEISKTNESIEVISNVDDEKRMLNEILGEISKTNESIEVIDKRITLTRLDNDNYHDKLLMLHSEIDDFNKK